jgi:long-chain acyl-CoA synthetase
MQSSWQESLGARQQGPAEGNEPGLVAQLLNAGEAQLAAEELPLERAYYWEKRRPRQIFLTQPFGGGVRHWRWTDTMNEARRMAAYLKAQNWPPGSRIVILSKNCAWWILAELAIWMSDHVTVPLYTSLPVESARRLIEHCGPVACFIGPVDNAALPSEAIPTGTPCIRFPNAPACQALDWDSLIAATAPLQTNPVRSPQDLATIIYTSGTTGSPKGVMHRFAAFPYFAKAVTQVTGKNQRHRVFSYLPLAHIAERALTETGGLYEGWRIFFCESPDTFLRDLQRARPTVFFSVPRLYAKFQAGVLQQIPQRKLDWLLRIPLLGYFVKRRILRKLGLGAARVAASGSAPIPLDLLLWFRKLGLPLSEGYGTTEAGITHTALDNRFRPGYVGCSAPGVDVRIAENRELLVRSPMNMLGYYGDPEATREALLSDGFIRTGDLGEVDEEGWLKINGRIKEQFKTSKGKYVSPAAIEMMLNVHSAIESCLVMGSGLAAPFAVVVLSLQAQQSAELEHSLEGLRQSVNAKLAPHEQLKFLVLTRRKWSVDNGFLTPTLKLKRPVLEAHYAPCIPGWTAAGDTLIWHINESE